MKPSSVGIAVAALLLLVAACKIEAPGEGEKASQAKAEAALIIAALKAYRADTGSYPARIEDLFPKYLSKIPLQIGQGSGKNVIAFGYVPNGAGEFELHFKYWGPGSNTCSMNSEREGAGWDCGGAW